jgi:uncharacterized protein YdhG (YjbR/CyaY superfamily)
VAHTVDEYIASFPDEVQSILREIRGRIHRAVPGAGEKVSYGIATFTLDDRYFIYLAGWKQHIAVYPIPPVDEELERELAPYRAAKGTLRFPLRKPIPYDLIERIAAVAATVAAAVAADQRETTD